MILNILSPEKILYEGKVELVTLPGINGAFTVLDRHAPIISTLNKGYIIYQISGESVSVNIEGGFVEKKGDIITICIE
ncbi:MAG: ATP synthase F1 subunit epsilon [Candidatus Azobacteroides pseudotrichonymphae]|jgi:F-type H+-transporting ATPase subunit epsilon|uniref:F-type ATP synthase epsilon subunit n=1 Tax=Azobacteroides pseudotrichonymphae genomovar. CFP2 TaxID=511995 RepID=B6YQC4_AZOPC|nr:F0F1 ATP synthase subunit epsilon [Candidatus Azobacteroides pseudotrichonymphae]MDR0530309.1 F0F1 ATP synthase subunit epsilon [Bacteroidales bacterium OttesenSCG-928-I14]BAG83396.1 F-type ATP synthase epsilon subunit [Candidatus Azobacteroides pseudotrichonymphae genomovar. CFP2]GMO35763.1 MAG: ATP synthase F1 subunit epsilon [Candidatus Azobacteroides pseudotrichonymphae]